MEHGVERERSAVTEARIVGTAAAGLLLVMFSAGLAWRDCTMLATSLVLAYRLLLLHMDRGSPWRALTAALNALSGGLLLGAAGLALVLGILGVWFGWWYLSPDHPDLTLLMLALSAAACAAARGNPRDAWEELRVWLWLFAGVVVAIQARLSGLTTTPCVLALAVGLMTLRSGWLLSRDRASLLLRAGTES